MYHSRESNRAMLRTIAVVACVILVSGIVGFGQSPAAPKVREKHGGKNQASHRIVCGADPMRIATGVSAPTNQVPAEKAQSESGLNPASGAARRPKEKQKKHSVKLRWNPSSTKRIAGYCVYRAEGDPQGPYISLNTVPLRRTTFVDDVRKLKPGKTYFYQVSAIARTGVESERTPPAAAQIPGDNANTPEHAH
jgi:hypothetical protein